MPNKALTKEQRHEQRLRYYAKHREKKPRSRKRVTEEELILIQSKSLSDVSISHKIGRSVEAIQLIRTKIKNGHYKIDCL
jgi:anti-sigma28 factor (negative regulator of flagellin synthesis)